MMKLTILGSGSVVPRLKRGQSAYILKDGKNLFLLDCGAGTLRQMLKAGIDYRKIDNIFITHFHPDHVNELPAIIIAHLNEEKLRTRALNLYGPKGFKAFYHKLLQLYPCIGGPRLKFKINLKELGKSEFRACGMNISTVSTRHTANSIAYRIERKGKVLVYSGDTGYGEVIPRFAQNADVLLLECSFPNRLRKLQKVMNTHLIPELCGEMAAKAGAGKLVLTHLYPQAEKVDIKKEAKKKFNGRVVVARDFMEVKI